MSTSLPHYRFVLDVETDDERPLGRLPVEPDFEPLERCAHFEMQRRSCATRVSAPAHVEPVWDARGEPFVAALRVTVDGVHADEVPITYFRRFAERSVAALVAAGDLAAGDSFTYSVRAFRSDARASHDDGLCAEDAPREVPIATRALAPLRAASRALGSGADEAFPVFIAPAVLEEALELARAAGECESGGVLVGRLCRASDEAELFLEITGLIPARHATATSASFTFSAETWNAAQAALTLRGGGVVLAGWMHSHPFFCRACPDERRRDCAFARPAFSREDVHLQRTCFPAPHQLALLISDLGPQGLVASFYGWQRGQLGERGVRVLEEEKNDRCAPPAIPT
jgi:proteasome lid subunit RPN8/RPN11